MIKITGYNIEQLIYKGFHSTFYRGTRISDNIKVIVKILNSEYPTLEELENIKREYLITNKPYGDKVIKVYGIENYKNSICIILEDFGAISLSELLSIKKLDLNEKVSIAVNIADAVWNIHKQGVIHKDINPYNIVINPETNELKVIDFGISTDLKSEKLQYLSKLEGTCLYIPPEQTGKINRIIDQRSDLYSVGVTLYELFTGKVPFTGDNLEIIHAHLAKMPINPSVVNREVPQIISEIIMKLLSKDTEDRYQTSFGLKCDLEYCKENLLVRNKIIDFKIAQSDIPTNFQIPQKLYGRDEEIGKLKDVIRNIRDMRVKLVMVSGCPGIGKTSIVHEIMKDVIDKGGQFVSGKFEQFEQNIPYSALISAFRELIKNLVSDAKNLELWKDKFIKTLGSNAKIIADLIPELEQITGELPDVIKLNPTEEKNRFNLVFRDFVNSVSNKQTPLVIYLDDVQWSDLSTIELIKYLLSSPEIENFNVIIAYRDNEITEKHPLKPILEDVIKRAENTEFLKHIFLNPLKKEAVNELLSDTLKQSLEDTKTLTDYIYQKTKGNPFFTNHLLKSIYDIGAFKFNVENLNWEWDLEKIEQLQVSDNVIEFLIQNLSSLSDEALSIIKSASCIGNYFDLRTLYKISDSLKNESYAIWTAIERELIIPLDNNYRLLLNISKDKYLQSNMEVRFKFSHGRIQQAVYSLIPEDDKVCIHNKIGKVLLTSYRNNQSECNIFELVNHLNLSKSLITNKDEILELAQLNVKAGKKAMSNSSYDIAGNYFNIGKSLLFENGNNTYKNILFDISLNYAQTCYLSGNIDKAIDLCEDLSQLATDNIEKAKVCILKTSLYDLKFDKKELILYETKKALELFDIFLPEGKEEIEQKVGEMLGEMQECLSVSSPEELAKQLPIMKDENKITAMKIMANALPTAFQINLPLYLFIQLIMFDMTVKYGISNASCKGFGECGIAQSLAFNNYDVAYKFGLASFTIVDRLKAEDMRAGTYFVFASLISYWKAHYSESIEYFDLSIKVGLENGDILHPSYSIGSKFNFILSTGENLNACKIELEKVDKFLKNNNATFLLVYSDFYQYMINQLQSTYNYDMENSILESTKETGNIICLSTFGHINLMVNYLLENFEAAEKWYDFAETYAAGKSGSFNMVDYYMFQSLLFIKKYENALAENKDEILNKLNSNLAKLKTWSDNCPDNFAHKYYIVLAEFNRIQDSPLETIIDLYKKSLDSIRDGDFIHMRALINEITGEFWLLREYEIIGSAYIKEAYYLYKQWGASEKVKILNTKYPDMFRNISDQKISSLRPNSIHTSVSDLDLMSILKASQAISKEIKLDKLLKVLLETVIENAGAQYGFIVLKNLFDDNLYVEALKSKNDEIKIMDSTPISDKLDVCLEVLQTVIRTKEHIVIEDALKDQHYQYNDYIKSKNVRSVLCAPIIYQSDLKGIIYLENNLTDNAFSIKQLEVIKMLSSQIALSIEKAQLSQALIKIKETQKQLVQSEKMASLGNLVAGIAHEINTPVGVAVTAVTHMIGTTENIIKSYNDDNISKSELEDYLNDSMETIELLFMNLNKAASLINGFKRVSADMSNEDLRTFNFKKYIKDILLSLSPKLKKYKHKIEVVCDEDMEIYSYPGVYSQIITNLLINSITHAYSKDDEGNIEIRVFRDENNIKLVYSDDGKGMDSDTKSKIFEPFFTTNRHTGTGLGMHIVFNLVTQTLKGTITCESSPNKGAEFVIAFKVD